MSNITSSLSKEKFNHIFNEATLRLFKSVCVSDLVDKQKQQEQLDLTDEQCQIATDAFNHGLILDRALFALPTSALRDIENVANDLFGVDMKALNATFYQTFTDVTDRNVFERKFDQLLHYISVYFQDPNGRDVNHDYVFTLNDGTEVDITPDVMKRAVLIKAIDKDELTDRVKTMLSGIALNNQQIEDLADVILGGKLDIVEDDIKNKQAKVKLLCLEHRASDNFDLFARQLAYTMVDKSEIIKKSKDFMYSVYLECRFANSSEFDEEKVKAEDVNLLLDDYFSRHAPEELGHYIRRYRKFFILVRHVASKKNKTKLNRALRLSNNRYYNYTRKMPVLDHVLDMSVPMPDITARLKTATSYKLIKLLNFFKLADLQYRFYLIRNGKAYIKEQAPLTKKQISRMNLLRQQILSILSSRLHNPSPLNVSRAELSHTLFYVPQNVEYGVPTSEKSFVGAMPLFSSVEVKLPLNFGISWHKQADFDLHVINLTGGHYGWNEDITDDDHDIVLTGDMVALNKQGNAAEFAQIRYLSTPIMFLVLGYNVPSGANHYDLFMQEDCDTNLKVKHVINHVNEDSVLIKNVECHHKQQQTVGFVLPIDDKHARIFFLNANLADASVPDVDMSTVVLNILQQYADKCYKLTEYLDDMHLNYVRDKQVFDQMQAEVEQAKRDAKEAGIEDMFDELGYTQFVDLSVPNLAQDTFLNLVPDADTLR